MRFFKSFLFYCVPKAWVDRFIVDYKTRKGIDLRNGATWSELNEFALLLRKECSSLSYDAIRRSFQAKSTTQLSMVKWLKLLHGFSSRLDFDLMMSPTASLCRLTMKSTFCTTMAISLTSMHMEAALKSYISFREFMFPKETRIYGMCACMLIGIRYTLMSARPAIASGLANVLVMYCDIKLAKNQNGECTTIWTLYCFSW